MGTQEETAPATPTQVEEPMLAATEAPVIPVTEIVEETAAVEMPVAAMVLHRTEMAAEMVTPAEMAKVGE
jgi:hypothetical protein